MPDARSIDRESRRLIREDLSTNFLVEAGAGSGKTQMLAERMAAGVAAGVYEIEHMAAVTFTRKAASELRGRFQLALEARLAELSLGRAGRSSVGQDFSPAEQRIHHALGNLERLFAGTIHSFCARLLRERPVESGVCPGFTELDELQDLELRRRAWRDFIAGARAAGDPDMVALLDAGVKPQDLDQAFAVICVNEDVEFPPGDGPCPDLKPAWKAIERFWKALEPLVPDEIDPETPCPIQKAARDFRGQLRIAKYRKDRPSFIASVLDTWDCKSQITQNRWASTNAEKRRLRDLINPLHEAFRKTVVEPYLGLWRQYVYRLAVSLLVRARAGAALERRRRNSLNYGDLLNLAVRVLRENPQVRAALQRKYRHLFVDEFQDTDPVQAEIVFLLAGDETAVQTAVGRHSSGAAGAADWRTIPLRPGSLFVVGDPKQSIYRFRRADIDIYTIVRERFGDPAAGRVLPLTMNFRSGKGLCTWANQVFATRFPGEPTRHEPKFAALEPKEDAGPGEVRTITHGCDKKELVPEDAAKIATYIRFEVDAGRRRFSDFLVLTKSKRQLESYAGALEEQNVPIEVSGAGAFGESAEVRALAGLLRALADPMDALSLVAVLRGPFFGISDRDLFAFKQSGGWFSIFFDSSAVGRDFNPGGESAVGRDFPPHGEASAARRSRTQESPSGEGGSPGASRVADALAALRRYHRWTRIMPVAAALDRILEHTGYLALAATTPGGVEAGDLVHAVDRVRQIAEDGGSLADAVAALDDDREESTEVESLPLEPGRTDVVRLMNLHKAKGLEANVVFLADPCGGWPLRADVHIERRGRKAQGWFKVVHKREGAYNGVLLGQHADWPAHEAAELPYLEAEDDRLLYVAATRARQMLVVSRWTGNHNNRAWGVLNEFLGSARELKVPAARTIAPVKPLDCSRNAQADAEATLAAAHDRVREPSWSITSVTAEAHHVAGMTRAVEASADDPTKVVSPDTAAHRADAGMAWGTLIHGLLEHAMRHKGATREDLRRLAMWLTVEEPERRQMIDEALETVTRAMREEFWTRARNASASTCTESPFTVNETAVLTSGVIDLLYDSSAGLEIVDYKTDRTLDAARYSAQLEAYRRALGLLGCTVAGTTVIGVRSEPV